MGKNAEAAESAKFVADRWIGPDHNEAVELWNSIPASVRSGESVAVVAPEGSQAADGKVKSIVCADEDQRWSLVLDQGGQFLTFHRKAGFLAGFSDTIWYGRDHFNYCHHIQGLRAIVHYQASTDPNYAGDIAELEIRDDLPER
jgi:hypothetical protein